jgi:hypothetical protein
MESNQIPELRELLTRAKTERHKSEIVDMLDQHKTRLLEVGAAGRLLIAAPGQCVAAGASEADHARYVDGPPRCSGWGRAG